MTIEQGIAEDRKQVLFLFNDGLKINSENKDLKSIFRVGKATEMGTARPLFYLSSFEIGRPRMRLWNPCLNIAALKLLGFSCDKPYTPYKQHPSHEKKIHIIFDTPHLVKIVCNNPIRHDIIIGEKTVSWKYLEAVYSLDKVYSIR